jgi:CRISPR/Cas system CSM-associated protein Csm2 small subunit
MGKCKTCGGSTLGDYEYCLKCKPPSNRPRQDSYQRPTGQYGGRSAVPSDCIFKDSFYAQDGYLRREIFIEAAEKMADLLQSEGMTQTSIRHLFNMIKATEMRLKVDKNLPNGFIRENFLKFVTHTEYQFRRGVVRDLFKEFVESHKDLAVKDRKEFRGFVEYLTSIVARMKQK